MPKLRTFSGRDIIKIFKEFDFSIMGQKGSHVKLGRVVDGKHRQTLTIPNHKETDKGTVKAIYRQALRYIPEDELKSRFYK